MPDNYLRLIPTDPSYVPPAESRDEARELFHSFLPRAEAIDASVTENIEFVSQGANFESIWCPACGAELPLAAWRQAMDSAYRSRFADLMITMPCCDSRQSLNDLRYVWPAGFARFVLQARNPGGRLNDKQIAQLENALACRLREILAHY